mgnify:CR=1 FL=1
MSRSAAVQGVIGTLPGATSAYAGAWTDYPSTLANTWCTGEFRDVGPGTYRAQSEHAMRVFDTDALFIKVRRYVSGTIAAGGSEYACGAVIVGTVGARYGTTVTSRLTAPDGTTAGMRTTTHRLPSGTKRVWVIGGALSLATGQHLQEISFPTGSSVTEVSEPATGTVSCDGYGSLRLAYDGFVVSGGVLATDGTNIALRAAYTARIAQAAPTEVYYAAGTNTLTDAVAASDYQVAVDAWVTATLAGAPTARIVLQSILRRSAFLESATAPPYRTATAAVATARSLTYVDGLPILDLVDLSSDLLHPVLPAQSKISTAILANITLSKRTLLYVDSIISGSCDPQNGAGYRGPVHLVRTARA